MVDILERLQSHQTSLGTLWPQPNLHEEAAAEIARLRAENKRTRSLLHWDIVEDEEGLIICDGNHEKRLYWQSAVDELRAENEKLRAEQSRLQSAVLALTGENEKLRAALAPFVDAGHLKVVTNVEAIEENNRVSIGVKESDLRAAAAAIREGRRGD